MNLHEISERLYDDTFLLGRFRRKAALRVLLESSDPEAIGLLVQALRAEHADAKKILAGLGRLSVDEEPAKVVALWEAFSLQPFAALAKVLARLGWPPGQRASARTLRDVLAVATADTGPEIMAAVAAFAEAQPVGDEACNDEIYGAWIRSQSDRLEGLIAEQGREPRTPALEALLALATGDMGRYRKLGDDDGAFLIRAYNLAPPAFRARIARTVAESTDRGVKDAYNRALAGEGLDPSDRLASLQQVNDEDGLFELTRHLTLLDVLGLCGRWADMPGRPTRPEQAAVVDRALVAYRALGQFQVEPGPTLPEGLVDLFDYWRGQNPSDADLRADSTADDPFAQARGLYLGHERGIVDAPALAAAAKSEHWPLRLVARLLDPATLSAAGAAQDHVLWVSACAGDAALLSTPIGGSPKDYARHSRQKAEARGGAAGRIRALLEILCAFQGAFVASEVSLQEIDEPAEATGVTLDDAPDVDFD